MATLEKIRSKSVLLFTVIIVALLAFILGDFFTSGRSLFGGNTTVGEIGDHEIDVQLYQQRLNEETQGAQIKGDDLSRFQTDLLRGMLFEKMLEEEWEDAGIYVTDKELADYMSRDPQFEMMVNAVKNPAQYKIPAEQVEEIKAYLAKTEKAAEMRIKSEIYGYMFQGLFTANELDAKDAFDTHHKNYNISFTSKELASLKDEDFQVSDDEVKAEWEKNKKVYELEREQRSIKYFSVQIDPSTDDYIAAEKTVNEAIVDLYEKPGVEAIANNYDFNVKTKTYSPRQIQDPELRSFVDSAKEGDTIRFSRLDKTYRLAKLLSAKQEMDEVTVSKFETNEAGVLDSILNKINSGVSVATLLNENKNQNIRGSENSQMFLSDVNVTKELKAKLLNTSIGDKVLDTTLYYDGTEVYTLYIVNETTPAVKISEVAEIEYTVKPSDKTISDINSKLEKFLAENKTVESIVKNAPKAGYFVNQDYIDATSYKIGFNPQVYYSGVSDSRAAIKWAMNAEKGEISAPFADDSRILVVAVTGIYEDYITADDEEVKKSIIAKIRNDKKAEKIIADFKSKKVNDLEGYAALTEQAVSDATVSFFNSTVPTLSGNNSALVGAIAGAKEGELVGPIKTNNAVVIVKVNSITPMDENVTYTFREGKSHFANENTSRLSQVLFEILKGNDKYECNLLDFYEK